MLSSGSESLSLRPGSTRNLSSMITQQRFLSSLLEQLSDSSKESQVLSMLTKVKAEMTDPQRLRLFVAGDENRLSEQSCDALRVFPSLPDGSSPRYLTTGLLPAWARHGCGLGAFSPLHDLGRVLLIRGLFLR